jgi:cytochrome c oxidase subunit 2
MKKLALTSLTLAILIAMGIGIHAGAQASARIIKITAKRFSFTPNEITLKKDEPVILELTTEDVTHGFYMKKLGIDEVIEPGKTTRINLTPRDPGRYLTICDHFCGSGHGNMNMTIVVE